MTKTAPRFWMVWNPRGRLPEVQHSSRARAVAEAKRLATNNPGQSFYVLKAVGGFEADSPKINRIKLVESDAPTDDEIPF